MNRPIGVFDSGIGGLTVVKELISQLPKEEIIYIGDTARLPYGNKSKETVIRFSLENTLFLLRQNVKLIVVACNTTSSLALPLIKRNLKIPVIGVVNPISKKAVITTRNKRIGVIGTRATIKSRAYENQIKKLNRSIKVKSLPCPLFVPLVEEGWVKGKEAELIARRYLNPLKKFKIDTLILGCTHYPLLKATIKKALGDSVALIDSAREVATQVKKILKGEDLAGKVKANSKRATFYVTDEPKNFARLAKRFLGQNIRKVYKINYV